MPTNREILNELDSELLEQIRKLAASSLAPNQIAVKLGIDKGGFLRIWRDQTSLIREAYEAGLADIKAIKGKYIKKAIKGGNVVAIQIQHQIENQNEFEAKKREIFGLDE